MVGMEYQITESKQVSHGKKLCQIYIDSLDALRNIPKAISDSFSVGSIAYTPVYDIYTLTSKGWVDVNGEAVSI